jgi:hypothetical protein
LLLLNLQPSARPFARSTDAKPGNVPDGCSARLIFGHERHSLSLLLNRGAWHAAQAQ